MSTTRLRKACLLLTATAIGFASLWTRAGFAAAPAPPDDFPAVPASSSAGDEPTQTSETAKSAPEREAALKDRRTRRGNQSLDSQVRARAAEAKITQAEVRNRGSVAVSFKVPMPADVYSAFAAEHSWTQEESVVLTSYVQLEDGYPFMVSALDLPAALENLDAFMRSFSELARDDEFAPRGPDHTYQSDPEFANRIDHARNRLPHLSVVVGVTIPFNTFVAHEDDIRRSVSVAASEVEVAGVRPFKSTMELVTEDVVEKYRDYYRREGTAS